MVQDIFDSYAEYLPLLQKVMQHLPGYQLLLLNLPGQAYTIYDEGAQNYTSFYHASILDQLLFRLNPNGLQESRSSENQDPPLDYKFIGIGYGGFIV